MILKLSLVLTVGFLIIQETASEWNCDLFFHFAKVCDRFDYDKDFCFEFDTTKCDIVKTTYNDYKCPTYICEEIGKPVDLVQLESSKGSSAVEEHVLVSKKTDYVLSTNPIGRTSTTLIKPTETVKTTTEKLISIELTSPGTLFEEQSISTTQIQSTSVPNLRFVPTLTTQLSTTKLQSTAALSLKPTWTTNLSTTSRLETTDQSTSTPTKQQVLPKLKIFTSVKVQKEKQIQKPSTIMILPPKVKKSEWKKFSFRSVANDGIDCGGEQCYLEYRVLPDCYVILETNNTHCKIPCVMDGCDTELHHFIPCPLWNCVPNAPTTTSTTTSTVSPSTSSFTSTTQTPNPFPPNSDKMSALIYTSIVLNIFFFAILCAFVIGKCRVWISQRRIPIRIPSIIDLNPNQFFSLGDSDSDSDPEHERDPLLHTQRPALAQAQTQAIVAITNDSLVVGTNQLEILPPNQNILDIENQLNSLGIENQAFDDFLEPTPSPSNWQEISLESNESQTNHAGACSLNKTKLEQKEKKTGSIFLFMKKVPKK